MGQGESVKVEEKALEAPGSFGCAPMSFGTRRRRCYSRQENIRKLLPKCWAIPRSPTLDTCSHVTTALLEQAARRMEGIVGRSSVTEAVVRGS